MATKPAAPRESAPAYPKPGRVGGILIREVIRQLREQSQTLPISSHILIATSGGIDSTALAILIARYGRRVAHPSRVTLLHINHGWRAEASDGDERHVQSLAHQLGIGFEGHRLTEKPGSHGESWEDHARRARKKIFREAAKRHDALVLTAHQADDLAETVLWRLFTGAAATHGGGILRSEGPELRPLLGIRKAQLREFLIEERAAWREDETNEADRFLRARMRKNLMPEVEKLFPRAVEHLVTLAFRAQTMGGEEFSRLERRSRDLEGAELLLRARSVPFRRPHLEEAAERLASAPDWTGKIDLPRGWILERSRDETSRRLTWVLREPPESLT